MEHTQDKIYNHITLLSWLLNVFAMLNNILWYDNDNPKYNLVNNIGITCSNCGKITGSFVKNKNYKDMFTIFVLNAVLHHVGLSQIIETH